MENQVQEEVKTERLVALQQLLREQQMEFNKQFIGKEIDVLFDKLGKYKEQIIGKSPHLQSVIVRGSVNLIGSIKKVRIIHANVNSMNGVISITKNK